MLVYTRSLAPSHPTASPPRYAAQNMLRWPLLAGAVLLAACNEDITIVEDAPAEVVVGGTYLHKLSASKPAERQDFGGCDDTNPYPVAPDGTLEFSPKKPGTLSFCVTLSKGTRRLDEYRFTVVVKPQPPEDPDKAVNRAAIDALRDPYLPLLERARAATRAVSSPEQAACPGELSELTDEQRTVSAIPEEPPNWNVSGMAEITLVETLSALSPASLRLKSVSRDTREDVAAMERITKRRFVMLYRHDALELPTVKGDKYEGGVARGWVFVVDLQQGPVVCQQRFQYEPPTVVSYERFGLPAGVPKPAGADDRIGGFHVARAFHDNGKKAFAKLLADLPPGWLLAGDD